MQPDELKTIRKHLGLTQRELADALGMSLDSISRMERAVAGYPIEQRTALAVKYLQIQALVASGSIRFHSQGDDMTAEIVEAMRRRLLRSSD